MGYNSKYTGTEVESLLEKAGTAIQEHQDISGKQDVISDLAAIRDGASKGATALQDVPSEYVTETELTNKGYATTSSVNTALEGKVDKVNGKGLSTNDFTTALKTKLEGLSNYDDAAIQQAVTGLQTQLNALVSGDVDTAIESFNEIIAFLEGVEDTETLDGIIASIEQQIAAKYTKPSTGIPKSDLESAVQTSLSKADTALQEHQSLDGYVKDTDLATVATSGNYADLSNKPTIPTALSDLTADASHRTVTDTEKSAWNNKSDFSGSYNDLTNKPTIPSALSALTDDASHRTVTDTEKAVWNAKSDFSGSYNDLTNKPTIPSAVTVDSALSSTSTNPVQNKVINSALSGKQATISDLSTIRSGASAGATAVQPSDLADVATSGSYNDLTNKPTIPSAVTESTVSGWGFTKNTGTYSKPSNGIPKADLESSVQSSLNKADTALQTEQYTGTYSKPSGGIPKSDLASAVQTSLGKADTALQSYTETDPTVPSWAKAASKPAYTASEVGAVPTTRKVNGKALSADITLSASDVSALPNTTVIPTKVSELTNDSNFTSNTGTITGITMNGTSKGTSGVVNLGTVITSHQDISGKQDKLVSGTNIKTVNGNSLLGSGDIVIEGGGGDYLPLAGGSINGDLYVAKDLSVDGTIEARNGKIRCSYGDLAYLFIDRYGFSYIDGNKSIDFTCQEDGTKFLSNDGSYKAVSNTTPVVSHGTSDTSFALTPNVFHKWGTVSSLSLTLATPSDPTLLNEYIFQFTSGSTATSLTLPSTVKWTVGPTIEPNKTYQVSIIDNLGVIGGF